MDSLVDELITLRDWLRWAVSRFTEAHLCYGHGTDNAFDEAAWLILHALHLPHERLEAFLDARLTRHERLAVLAQLEQRVHRRVPAAYLTHEAWLGEFRFYVDERVIVPRSYIAELLAEGLDPWVPEAGAVGRVLDLCTGSGCLAILAAHAFPQAQVDGVDLSPDALAVARRNVADYGLAERLSLLEGDLFHPLGRKKYDVIISNPPYVTQAAMDRLPPEYRHEPAMALGAGEDGMDLVRRIVANAKRHLNPRGVLLVEVGHNQAEAEAALPDVPLMWLDTPSDEGKVFLVVRDHLP